MNSSHNEGFPVFHLIERCNIEFYPKFIGEVTTLANLHIHCLDALRDRLVDLHDGLLHHRADALCPLGTVFEVGFFKGCFCFIDHYHEGASLRSLQQEPNIPVGIALGQRLELPTGGILKHIAIVPVIILFHAHLGACWVGFDESQDDQQAASPQPEVSRQGAL